MSLWTVKKAENVNSLLHDDAFSRCIVHIRKVIGNFQGLTSLVLTIQKGINKISEVMCHVRGLLTIFS